MVAQFTGSKSCINIVNGWFCVGRTVQSLLKFLLGQDLISQYETDFVLQWVSILIFDNILQERCYSTFLLIFCSILPHPDVLVWICWLVIIWDRLIYTLLQALQLDQIFIAGQTVILPLWARTVMLRCSGCMVARRTNVFLVSSKQTYKL